MKKIAIMFVAALTLGIVSSSYVEAAWLARQADGSVIIPVTGTRPAVSPPIKPSANVFLNWAVEASGTAYTLGTTHSSGTYLYATTSGDTNIYRFLLPAATVLSSDGLSITQATVPPAAPSGANVGGTWGTGWTASK